MLFRRNLNYQYKNRYRFLRNDKKTGTENVLFFENNRHSLRSRKNQLLSLLRSSKKSPQNLSTNLLFLWNNLSISETSQKFQTNLVNFVTNFANFFLQKNIYFESKNHPKAKRLKNLKNHCELCENIRELRVTKTLRKTLLHYIKQIP